MAHFNTSFRLVLATALTLSATSALAQSGGNFGGSFEPDAPPAQVMPPAGGQTPPATGGDNFGGSFGSGGGNPPAPAGGGATPPPPPPPPVNGGGDFGAGGNTPPPPPQPQPPQPQPPQPEQPSGIDPQIEVFELRDFGVPPANALRNGQFHAPTPTSIQGGQIVTTAVLSQALNAGRQVVLIDVLGDNYSLPGALMAPALASGGDFNDRIQQQAGQWLGQITRGDRGQTIVLYCSDPNCWLSYNATLRVIAAGYTNVYWYRGGLQAWQMAGLQLVPAGF